MKTLILDMYGVVIKESKGNFTPYVYSRFPDTDRDFYRKLYIKASTGEIDSDMFFRTLGFEDPNQAMRDYIENHLTLDDGFLPFAERFAGQFPFALLSNDVLAWSEHIRCYHNIERFFDEAVISANAHFRKPDREIYDIAVKRLGIPADECIFIDNSVENLISAREIGMETVLFNRDNEEYDGYVVDSFDELSRLIFNANWLGD